MMQLPSRLASDRKGDDDRPDEAAKVVAATTITKTYAQPNRRGEDIKMSADKDGISQGATWLHTTTTRTSMRVAFDPAPPSIFYHSLRKDESKMNISLWYTNCEFLRFKQESDDTLYLLKHRACSISDTATATSTPTISTSEGYSCWNDDYHCAWGLYPRTRRGSKERKIRHARVVQCVLKEQEIQRRFQNQLVPTKNRGITTTKPTSSVNIASWEKELRLAYLCRSISMVHARDARIAAKRQELELIKESPRYRRSRMHSSHLQQQRQR